MVIAKNYLNQAELNALNNLAEQYLIFAEGQAMRRIPMTMQDWIKKLDGFMTLNDRNILDYAGKVSHQVAKTFAEIEYDRFHHQRLQDEAIKTEQEDIAALEKLEAKRIAASRNTDQKKKD